MWAGGELLWRGKENLLRVGQIVTETTTVLSAEGKRTKSGEEMVVVGVEKEFSNEKGWAVRDRRYIYIYIFIYLYISNPPRPRNRICGL
jgi:hydroxyacyl-ACP dehydratase HTD2-like protein with hotdog domain